MTVYIPGWLTIADFQGLLEMIPKKLKNKRLDAPEMPDTVSFNA